MICARTVGDRRFSQGAQNQRSAHPALSATSGAVTRRGDGHPGADTAAAPTTPHAHDPVAGGRERTTIAVFTIGVAMLMSSVA